MENIIIMVNRLSKIRRLLLVLAEIVDAWRVTPRLMIIAYGALILKVFAWYTSIKLVYVTKCDSVALQLFISQKMDIHQAQQIACTIADQVGGPTMSDTTLVTAVFGLAPIIFGIYASTGTKWNSVNYSQLPQINDRDPDSVSVTPTPTPAQTEPNDSN
jgi:hypothetical protein